MENGGRPPVSPKAAEAIPGGIGACGHSRVQALPQVLPARQWQDRWSLAPASGQRPWVMKRGLPASRLCLPSWVATLTASGTADPELGEGAVQLFSALWQTSGQPYQTTCGPRGPSGKGCSHRETRPRLRLAGTLFTWGKCISF